MALSNLAKPRTSQTLIVPGSYCVINRKPEEFLLDDKHTSALTLKSNKLFKILEITKFDDHLGIPKEVKVQDLMTGRILQFDCARLQPLHLSDAFEFQLQLSDLVKEFPPSTINQITNRPPLISFKAGQGVFEDEQPLTIQQFPSAELYNHQDDDPTKQLDEANNLQRTSVEEHRFNSVNTMNTQPDDMKNGAEKDSNVIEYGKGNDPKEATEIDDNVQFDNQDQFYVASDNIKENDPQQTKIQLSSDNLQFKSILRPTTHTSSNTIDYMSYAEYDAFKKAITLANEMNTLHPSMIKYINHTYNPANIQYMTEAMPIPYTTNNNARKVTFINYTSKELEKQENTSMKLLDFNHKLLSLYVGLSTKMSQAELKMLQTTERLARL